MAIAGICLQWSQKILAPPTLTLTLLLTQVYPITEECDSKPDTGTQACHFGTQEVEAEGLA